MAFWPETSITSPPVLKIMLQDAVGSSYDSQLFCLWRGESTIIRRYLVASAGGAPGTAVKGRRK
jgi:hypothetical protein